jgi:hypothetical protein
MLMCGVRWRQTRGSGDQSRFRGPETAKINNREFENSNDHRHLSAMSNTVDTEFDPDDFSFIHRAGKSGPVERSPVFYKSMAEAAKGGKKALARILKQAA